MGDKLARTLKEWHEFRKEYSRVLYLYFTSTQEGKHWDIEEKLKAYDEKESEYDLKVLSEILDKPGQIVYLDSPELKNEFSKKIEELIEEYDEDLVALYRELELDTDPYDDIYNYVYRAAELKVLFCTREIPSKAFEELYSEAMLSWCHHLFNSAVVLLSAALENLMHSLLQETFEYLDKTENSETEDNIEDDDHKFYKLIEYGHKYGLLDKASYQYLHEIRKARNQVVHQAKQVSKDEVKKLIEYAGV